MSDGPIDKIIIGVDPGTVVMGFGVIHIKGTAIHPITLDVLKFNSKLDHYTRLEKIHSEVDRIVEQYAPDEMALEAPFFGKNIQSMLKLGRAQGVIMTSALHRKIPVFEYSPRLVKQSVVGNGNASKEQVSAMLSALFPGVSHSYLDATDALAVAVCHHFQTSGIPALRHGEGTKQAKQQKWGSSGKKTSWDQFIQQHPDRLK